ncbi:MAG: thiamine pyrophosphate-dependent dehydrogenase E1 component subunit alpha [Thermodesulfobacteriota bacterium]|jgi:TPP-dependent pyruvate/acetoin dehydrogenase alpha subunit
MRISEKDLRQMLYWMVLGRRFEERKMVLHRQGRIRGHLHPGQGQEAVHIGTCYGLGEGDYITLSHRGKEPELIKGYSLKDMMAGQMCKKEGMGEGRTPTGSHMYGDLSKGIIPSPGIIGSIIPVAAGVGLGLKLERKGRVVVCIFGDGATNRGDFHEGLNLAAALHLPVIFVLANNGLAISTVLQKATAGLSQLSVRAAGYGIPGVSVDGNDVRKVYEEAGRAIERARKGEGPTLLECMIQRWTGHSMSDPDTYRTEKEREEAREKDPVLRFKKELIAEGLLSEDEYMEIEQRVKKEIEEAIHYAEKECTDIDPDPSDVSRGVYAAS